MHIEQGRSSMDRTIAKNLVLKAGMELVSCGLIARTWGNVSCRIDEDTFVITPSGREYRKLTPDEIVEVKIDDLSYQGDVKPSSEKEMHRAVYRIFPDINFVIHTHQERASVLSAAGLDTIELGKDYPGLGDQIICAEYALPGSKALSNHAMEALKHSKGKAVILKHHGTLCVGEDCDEAFRIIHLLEEACGDYLNEKQSEIGMIPIDEKWDSSQGITNDPDAIIDDLGEFMLYKKGGFVVFNRNPEVIHFSLLGLELRPFLDDFAQIVGIKVKTVENNPSRIIKALRKSSAVFVKGSGALCWGINQEDTVAVSMITEKNCKAYFAASLFGKLAPIKPFECRLMRLIYLKKYSMLAKK